MIIYNVCIWNYLMFIVLDTRNILYEKENHRYPQYIQLHLSFMQVGECLLTPRQRSDTVAF